MNSKIYLEKVTWKVLKLATKYKKNFHQEVLVIYHYHVKKENIVAKKLYASFGFKEYFNEYLKDWDEVFAFIEI